SEWPAGTVEALHQVQVVGAGLGPCTVDSDELGIVSQRLDHGVRVMSTPCLVEPQFNFADRIFICLTHGPSVDFHHRRPATHSFYSVADQSHVRFGSKADMCVAKSDVRFTPNSGRESGFPQTVMSALPPKADMCGATNHVRFGPVADSCTAAKGSLFDNFVSAAATSKPSLSSSPWMRGAPHNGFSLLTCRMRSRRPRSIFGRPARWRDFQRQKALKPARCHRRMGSG